MNDDPPQYQSFPPAARRLPVGAEVQPSHGVHFRVWAPAAQAVAIEIDGGDSYPLTSEPGGYFSALIGEAGAGTRYRFRLDRGETAVPDPASRFQPDGPHGSSQVVDPGSFAWTDGDWTGIPQERLVVYEMHIGTFTSEGTWAAAARHLSELAELGITCIEMMPVAEFPGRFGWGYDGVDLFAPTRLYGEPDDLRRFVDRAHALGIAVILDVVYNHLGPDGNYLTAFAPAYTTDRYGNEWGQALNFDGPDAGPVREFFVANAGYWIDEYHLDGLRLDATQQIFDASDDHLVAAIARRVRQAAGKRSTFLSAENEPQAARLVRSPEIGGYGLDALWNDDFHHSAMVALTGRNEAYYSDFRGVAREFVAVAKHGFLFQGQRSAWQKQPRGTPAFDLPRSRFVAYLQNHDQIANSARGLRGHQLASPGGWRAMTAHFLLSPAIPLLFQGQEFSASSPFVFFADHQGDLGRLVREGRHQFLTQFPSVAEPSMRSRLPDPGDPETFRRCVLDHAERERHHEAVALHRDLLGLRRAHPAFANPDCIDAAALGDDIWVVRHFCAEQRDYLVIVNLGRDKVYPTISEPLFAPVEGRAWRLLWSSEHPDYGGAGILDPIADGIWRIAGHAATVVETDLDG
jgi:maltooligosyltrehalose trehalohydrolase